MKKQEMKEYKILKEYFEKIKNLLQVKPNKDKQPYIVTLGKVSILVVCCEMELQHIKKKGS